MNKTINEMTDGELETKMEELSCAVDRLMEHIDRLNEIRKQIAKELSSR